MKLLLTIILSIVFGILSPTIAEDQFLDDWDKQAEIDSEKNKANFEKKDWLALETSFTKVRDRKIVTSFGFPLLANYYDQLKPLNFLTREQEDAKWMDHLAILNEWEKAHPESITPKVMKLKFWGSFAWKARGDQYAHEVDQNMWKPYAERLDKAKIIYKEVLDNFPEDKILCPGFYSAAGILALGQGWSNKETYDQLVRPVIKIWPEYYPVYSNYAHRLEPKWYGREGDQYRFYNSLKEILGGKLGEKVSAYLIVKRLGPSINEFRYDLVKWEDLKKGMLTFLKDHSESGHMLQSFISFGIRYEGMDVLANEIKAEVPEMLEKFTTLSPYGKIVSATVNSQNRTAVLDYSKRPPSNYRIKQIRYAASHKNLDYYAYGQLHTGIVIIDSKDGSILTQHQIKNAAGDDYWNTNGVGMSASGKYIFAQFTRGRTNEMFVFEYTKGKLTVISKAETPLQHLYKAEFSEDESQIIFAGSISRKSKKGKKKKSNTKNEKSQSYADFFVWDWKKKKVKPKKIFSSEWVNYPKIVNLHKKGKVFGSTGKAFFEYDFNTEKVKPVSLQINNHPAQVNDIMHIEELNAFALLNRTVKSISLLDTDTYEVKLYQSATNNVLSSLKKPIFTV